MSKEQVDEIVDDLLNNRLELTSFVSDSLEQDRRVQDQQATIDSLSMAHDAIHREIPKDKHTLIKNLIALNKRVQDLEQWAFETKPYIKSLEQQNKLYRKAIELINNAWTVPMQHIKKL